MVDVLTALAIVLSTVTVVLLVALVRKIPYRYTSEQLEKIVDQRLERQLHIVKGQIGEQLAPHMKEFLQRFEAGDARFLGGKPVDYIVYKGYSRAYDTDEPIDGIVFLEVKTSDRGERGPDRNEAKIRDAVKAGKVSYEVVTIHTIVSRTQRDSEGT